MVKADFNSEEQALLSSLVTEVGSALLARRLELKIAEGERMRTAGLLASGVAHNFNNILQAIIGQASLLELKSNNQKEIGNALKVINQSASKGAELVGQLLSFTESSNPKKVECDINNLLNKNKDEISKLLRSGQSLHFQLEESLPNTSSVSSQVLRIIRNLISNASESMGSGSVELITELVEFAYKNPQVEIPQGSYVKVTVRDYGEGMSDYQMLHCFEPFFTTKDVDKGSGVGVSGAGLGLAVAWALARKNGGRLFVESSIGNGSSFFFVFTGY